MDNRLSSKGALLKTVMVTLLHHNTHRPKASWVLLMQLCIIFWTADQVFAPQAWFALVLLPPTDAWLFMLYRGIVGHGDALARSLIRMHCGNWWGFFFALDRVTEIYLQHPDCFGCLLCLLQMLRSLHWSSWYNITRLRSAFHSYAVLTRAMYLDSVEESQSVSYIIINLEYRLLAVQLRRQFLIRLKQWFKVC